VKLSMIRMTPEFIEKAQRRLDLLLRDCRRYMKIHCFHHWMNVCHNQPCDCIAFGLGVEHCEHRANELKFLSTILEGSSSRKKPGKGMYISKTRGWKKPLVRFYKP